MKRSALLLAVGAVVMTAAIVYAFVYGGLFAEAWTLLQYPWFHVSMIDLYLGFFLFSGWIIFREGSRKSATIWVVLLLTLGNLTACIYALLALVRARGDWNAFWLGASAGSGQHESAEVSH